MACLQEAGKKVGLKSAKACCEMSACGRSATITSSKFNAIWRLLLRQKRPLKLENRKSRFEGLVPSAKPPLGYSGAGLPLATLCRHSIRHPNGNIDLRVLFMVARLLTIYNHSR
jgi:hypothetical protein